MVTSKDQRSPLKQIGDTSFIHVREKDLYIVAVTKDNSDATGIFEVLYALIKIFKSYFGSFDEESVRDNIVTVVEVVEGKRNFSILIIHSKSTINDEYGTIEIFINLFLRCIEILDYGFPQTTDADSIKNLITTQSKAIKKVKI